MRAFILALFFPVPLHAGEVISTATGNWAGASNQGFYYRAELYENGDHVGLRICQSIEGVPASCPADQAALDVPQIQYRMTIGVNLQNVLEAKPDGSLVVHAQAEDEAYGFVEDVTIQMMDNQFTVMRYDMASVPLVVGDDEMAYACSVNIWEDRAENGGNPEWQGASFEDKNAAYWSPNRIYELQACPVIN